MPTLMLTARCTLADKVKALDIGADDFLSKPFEPAELAARCRALMRRSSGALDGIIKLNRMSVDLTGRRLCIDDAEVELTAREWLVLECLVRRTGQIVSKERVQQALAGPEQDITPNAVEVHVSRLRAKLGNAAVIRSLRGLGYRLEEAKSRVSSSISRQLVLWLAVPLMLLALVRRAGALLQQRRAGRDQQRPAAEGGRQRPDGAHRGRATARCRSIPVATARPPLPAPDSIAYAVRDAQGRLLLGDAQLPAGVDGRRDATSCLRWRRSTGATCAR